MKNLKHLYLILEKTVSNVKFAVFIITLFTIALVVGTFIESFHGADYANRLIYKSFWFMGIEVAIFISVFMAAVVRLPIKKRLHGFYVVHAGILILFMGAFFTYINGIDGSIQLLPNTPARKILINEDQLRVDFIEMGKSYNISLPRSPWPVKMSENIHNLELVEFLPYAEKKVKWVKERNHIKEQHSTKYLVFNENVSQELTLSLSPKSDFKSMANMGPLSVHYMPSILKDCFKKNTKSGFVIWNLAQGHCFTAEERKLKMGKTAKGARFVLVEYKGDFLKFFPDYSPVAMNDDLTKNANTPFRVLSKHIFQDKPNLFLFGKEAAFYEKTKEKWILSSFKDDILSLPWMNLKLRLLHHSDSSYPSEIPQYTKPVQENGNIIKGNVKAVKIKFYDTTYWVRNDGPLELSNGKETVKLQILPKEITLPSYQITLERFQMNTNPGTNNPASFESFVQLLDGRNKKGIEKHHIFMNNPLKYDDFTFYQSSYFPIGEDQYGSVLSVNYDPGRFFKYLGSLLLVLGSTWHYIINRKKKVIL